MRRQHVNITFWHYFRVGLPVTALTLAFGISGSRDSRDDANVIARAIV